MEHLIYNVEQKWLKTLFKVCRDTFSNFFLPSHDETHHYRVWLIARELISELGTHDFYFSETEIENIIIAIFFHDVGMAKNLDKDHGKISRKICEDFFKTNPDKKIQGLTEIYEAIENHDNKDYKNNTYHNPDPGSLFSVLCVCDDLDAFGITGIYRYAEIYLLRNININDLPEKVLDNLNSRFNYFQKNYGFLVRFAEKQKARYLTIKSFYEKLKKQFISIPYSNKTIHSQSGVINAILEYVLEKNLSPEKASSHILETSKDQYVTWFFAQLMQELRKNHPKTHPILRYQY